MGVENCPLPLTKPVAVNTARDSHADAPTLCGLLDLRLNVVGLTPGPVLSGNNLVQFVRIHVPLTTQQYNLVPVEGR